MEQANHFTATIKDSPLEMTSVEIPTLRKWVTGKKRRVVKVKRGPGKGRVRKSWLRAYPVKFTFCENNGTPIRDFFDTWAKAVIKPAEYTEKSL